MRDHVKVVDAIRKFADTEDARAQVDRITIQHDGNLKVSGHLVKRSTMFSRVWLVNKETMEVTEC